MGNPPKPGAKNLTLWSDTTYKGVPPGPLLYTLSAAFLPFILRIRNYRSETTKRTTNVTDKILNQKDIENLCGFSDEKEVATIAIGHLYEEVFLLEIISIFLSYLKLVIPVRFK